MSIPAGVVQRGWRGDERHGGAAVACGLGDRVPHLARGTVRDDAHGVDGFLGSSGGDDDSASGEGPGAPEELGGESHDFPRLDEASPAVQPGGEASLTGTRDDRAPVAQNGDVLADCWVLPHAAFHGGGDEQRRGGGERRRADGVVGEPQRELCNHVGSGRSDEHCVGGLGERDVLNGLRRRWVEQVGHDRPVRDGAEGEGGHELGGGVREQNVDQRARLRELAGEVRGLVCRDAPADAEQDALALERRLHAAHGGARFTSNTGLSALFISMILSHSAKWAAARRRGPAA